MMLHLYCKTIFREIMRSWLMTVLSSGLNMTDLKEKVHLRTCFGLSSFICSRWES